MFRLLSVLLVAGALSSCAGFTERLDALERRMPVIIERVAERDWIGAAITAGAALVLGTGGGVVAARRLNGKQ